MMLKIAKSLKLPMPEAATQTYAFIARKGAGKTYAAGKLTRISTKRPRATNSVGTLEVL